MAAKRAHFFFIDDNIEATTNAFYNNLIINDVVNIGGNKEITVLDLAKLIIDLTGSKSPIVHLPPLQEGDMTRRFPDIEKLHSQLLHRKPIPIEDGIRRILENPEFILKNGKSTNGNKN